MPEETEIQEIWFQHGGQYSLGKNADRIVLVADGHGISGRYDRIHVYHGNKHMIFPAHNVEGWLEKVKDEGHG